MPGLSTDTLAAAAGSRSSRIFTPVVEQHASWLALNPIQGCPNACQYCFLHDRGQARVLPEQLVDPPKALALLRESPLYRPDSAVAVCTWTDVMAVPSSRRFLKYLLRLWVAERLPNPVVLITKCGIPPSCVDTIATARKAGLDVVVYLSLSGLTAAVEQGIRHRQLIRNFPVLHAAAIPIVHYWRPALPRNAVEPVMTDVLDLAATYATCTMVAGLKVEPAARQRLARLWPALANTVGVVEAEGVYPRAFWEFTHRTAARYPEYPVFHSNACALAYTLGQADRFGTYGGPLCLTRNRCPDQQRRRCATADRPTGPTTDEITTALTRHGLGDTAFEYHPNRGALLLNAQVPNGVAAALSQELRVPVDTAGQGADSYWSSGTSGAQPLIIPGEA
jgi:DNA repair photolyase